jgi:hypothetical protein
MAFNSVLRKEFPDRPVQRVGAAADAGIDHCARRTAVFGAVVVGVEAELLHRVRRRLHHLVREALVAGAVGVIVQAVEVVGVECRAHAVDVVCPVARRCVALHGFAHAGREQRQVGVLAAVQREVDNGVVLDHLAAIAGVGF